MIAIGIPVFNALPKLKAMINSLLAYTNNFTLYIVDDGSNLETNNYIKSLPAKKIIIHRRQQWFSRSANDLLILSYLSGADKICLLNSDIILCENWLDNLLKGFEPNMNVGLVGSVFNGHGDINNFRIISPPNYVTGHCWIIDRKAMEKSGILDERMVHIESDKEYCYRLNRNGFKTLINYHIPINHYGGGSWHHVLSAIPNKNNRSLTMARPVMCLNDTNYKNKLMAKFKIENK